MNEQQNIQLTQEIFQAFATGNIPFLLNILADDIEWYVAGSREHLPLAGTYKGREQVAQVFQMVSQYLELKQFQPEEFVAQNSQVAVFGKAKGCIRPNNCVVEYDWVHLYTWHNGKVIKFREYLDTGAMAAAFQGVNVHAVA